LACSGGRRSAGCGSWTCGDQGNGGRRTGLLRETIRRALRSDPPPSYSGPPRGRSEPVLGEVYRLLRDDPEIESQRIRELLAEQRFKGGKTIVDDYVREVRPYYLRPRTYQPTVYRGAVRARPLAAERPDPGSLRSDPPGLPVVEALGYSRFGAGH
jgi:hypothetical protein